MGKPTDQSPFVSSGYRTVGDTVVSTDKLEVIAPFVTLAGLVLAVSAVVDVEKRRDQA